MHDDTTTVHNGDRPNANFTAIQNICAKLLRVEVTSILPSTRLVEDLDVDSLFAAELALALEKNFSVQIGQSDMASFQNVAQIVDFIDGRLKAKLK